MKQMKLNKTILVGVGAFLIAGLIFAYSQIAFGNITTDSPPGGLNDYFKTYTFFATSTDQTIFSTSTTAVSSSILQWIDSNGAIDNGTFNIAGAERVTFYFIRTGENGNEGTSTFDIDVTQNGTDWYDFNQLILNNASGTPSQYASVAVTGTTTQVAHMDSYGTFKAVRCSVTETTDGEHACQASAKW